MNRRARTGAGGRPVVAWLTNIPTPYRHHRFQALEEALDGCGTDLRVLYMAEAESHRPWTYDAAQARYQHRLLPGLSRTVAGRPLHLNPSVVGEARRQPAVLVVGGVSNPTAWLAMAARTNETVTLLGAESNARSVRLTSGPAAGLKRWMVSRADGFLVPGDASLEYLEQYAPAHADRPIVRVPNVIDECRFAGRASKVTHTARARVRAEWGVTEDEVVLLVPARLETHKGIDDVITAFEHVGQGGRVVLVLAGGGTREGSVRDRLAGLPVRVLGSVPDEDMAAVYAGADVMMLPSHRDPSPLAVVEALRSGLPLVLSDAVGNRAEALVSGDNGWVVPAARPDLLAEVIAEVGSMPRSHLLAMGHRSEEVHRERFATPVVLGRAARQLADLAGARGES